MEIKTLCLRFEWLRVQYRRGTVCEKSWRSQQAMEETFVCMILGPEPPTSHGCHWIPDEFGPSRDKRWTVGIL